MLDLDINVKEYRAIFTIFNILNNLHKGRVSWSGISLEGFPA